MPSSTDIDDRSGTPITGSSVCAATTPGSAAASPAPQISTLMPRPAAPFAYSATASGARCAERTSNSHAMPRASSSSVAPFSRSRSDSDPIRIPTSGSDTGHRRDVPPALGALERDEVDRRVRALARIATELPSAVTERILPPFVTTCPSLIAVPPWKTSAPVRSASSMPCDRRARVVAAGGVVGRRDDDRHGALAGQLDARRRPGLPAPPPPAGRPGRPATAPSAPASPGRRSER